MKALEWVGSSKKDLKAMPDDIQDSFGYALHLAQVGRRHNRAKILSGFGSADVLDVVTRDRDSTYRAIYTVKFADTIYVLHCIQKKSKRGIATPKSDMDLIRKRLKIAEARAKEGKDERKQKDPQ